MKLLSIFFFVCLLRLGANSQTRSCTQGCSSTTILLFDFDVKADTVLMSHALKRQIFSVAPAFRNRLTAHTSCLDFFDGNEVKQPGDIFSDGEVPKVNIQDDGPYHLGEYLITGSVVGSGGTLLVTVNVETSISRKIIKSIKIMSDTNSCQNLPERIEAALGSLEMCIKTYETNERENNMNIAFGQPITHSTEAGELLLVKPKKTKLQMGEETEVEIILKDCDGYPLKNRTVSFTGEMYDSLWRAGTYGGTITPQKVTTNAQGKAKVTFKAGRQYSFAAIVAHYSYEQPCGRKDVISGSAAIDMQLKPYRVIAYYTSSQRTNIDFHNSTSEYSEVRNSHGLYNVKYMIEFYYAPTEFQNGLSVSSTDTLSGKIYVAQEKGNAAYFATGSYLKRFFSGEKIYFTTLVNSNGFLVNGERAMLSADTSGLHFFSFALKLYKTGKLNGEVMEPMVYTAAQVTGYQRDGYTKFKNVMSREADSAYKLSSMFTYNNQAIKTDKGTTSITDEYLMIRIFVEK
jgi:hypothetical protein